MTLTQRIDAILGPWPTPDQTREAFLLLARHLQRHDELVTLQRDIDAYAECRRMPDDALDALEAHRDRLQQEIRDGTPIPHLAKVATVMQREDALKKRIAELEAELAKSRAWRAALADTGDELLAELRDARRRIAALEAQLADARDCIDLFNRMIVRAERKWKAAHPDSAFYPDGADLIVWLKEQVDTLAGRR